MARPSTGRPVVPAPPPPTLTALAGRIDARIRALLDQEYERWVAVDAALGEPMAALREIVLAAGKRLRPAFCHWAYVGAGGDPDDPNLLDAEAGVELLHNMAIIHDDIMDGSTRRHGVGALHTRFEERHVAAG